jgi:uncharacterized protein (TIGR02996 family)
MARKKKGAAGGGAPASTEAGFLRAILAEPDDDAHRLVYADWLDENGQPERAEFIRLQIERARLPRNDPKRQQPGERERALLEAHGKRWLEPLWAAGFRRYLSNENLNYAAFDRGLPAHAYCEMGEFVRWGNGIWRAAPITSLRLNDSFGGHRPDDETERLLRAVAARPEVAHITALDLNESGLRPQDVHVLLSSRHWKRLRDLSLSDNGLGDEGARVVAGLRGLPSLTELNIEHNGIGDEGVAALASSRVAGRLRCLVLSGNNFGDAGAASLAASRRLRNLQELHLLYGRFGDAGARALAASPHLVNLTQLTVFLNDVMTDAGRAALRERFGDRVILEYGQ